MTLFWGSPVAPTAMGKDKAPAEPAQPETGTEPQASAPSADAALQARIASLESELAAAKERAIRARADYDNLQKRVTRDATLERERAQARVLEGLLPLFELCQMAARQAELHPMPKEADGIVEGLRLLAREFQRFLGREGLVATGAVGEAFDRSLHEAVAEEAVEGVAAGAVSRVIQPGYRLGEKVLRFAKVAVQPASAK